MQKIILIIIASIISSHTLPAQTNNTPPRSALLTYREVEKSLNAKNFMQARNQATQILETTPSFKEAYRARAYANLELHNFQDAESDIKEFHKLLQKDRYDIFVLLARTQIAQTNYPAAIKSFEKVRELKPSTANIHLSLAKLYYQLGNYRMAETRLEEAVRLEPPHLQAAAKSLLKETQKEITKNARLSTYLTEAEEELRTGNITAALEKLEQWSASITNRSELVKIEKTKIFEVLYNRAQYKNMIKDVNTRLPDQK